MVLQMSLRTILSVGKMVVAADAHRPFWCRCAERHRSSCVRVRSAAVGPRSMIRLFGNTRLVLSPGRSGFFGGVAISKTLVSTVRAHSRGGAAGILLKPFLHRPVPAPCSPLGEASARRHCHRWPQAAAKIAGCSASAGFARLAPRPPAETVVISFSRFLPLHAIQQQPNKQLHAALSQSCSKRRAEGLCRLVAPVLMSVVLDPCAQLGERWQCAAGVPHIVPCDAGCHLHHSACRSGTTPQRVGRVLDGAVSRWVELPAGSSIQAHSVGGLFSVRGRTWQL